MRRRGSCPLRRRRLHCRPGITLGRQWTLLGAVAVVALACPAGVASADATAPLVDATVYEMGGNVVSDTVSAAALQANPQTCPAYSRGVMVEYGRSGHQVPVTLGSARWPLDSVLSCLQTPVSLDAVTGITVITDQGSPETGAGSQLTPADIASPSDFQSTGETPVVSDLGSSVEYDRPWRGGTDEDYLDEVVESQPLQIEVFEGPLLTVTVTPSVTSVAAGGTISFSATVTGQNGSPLSYDWSFGGGATSSTQSSPTVTFQSAGDWNVTLEVSDNDGGGGSASVPIIVTATVPTAPTTTGTSPTGPLTSAGTTPDGQPTTTGQQPTTPASGGHHLKTKPTPRRSPTTPATPATRTTAGTTSTTSTTSAPTASTPTGSTAPAPATTPAAPSPQAAPAGAREKPRPTAPPTGRRPASHRTAEPLVTGRLIGDVFPLPAGSSPLVHDVPASSPAAAALRPPRRASIISIVAGVLAVLFLLGLGAARELRGRRFPSPPPVSG